MRICKALKPLLVVGACALPPAALAAEPVQPIEPASGLDQGKVALGKQLYFDPRLSLSGFISCNSCHNLSMGGSDNIKSSVGHGWAQGPINSPTVLNSSLNLAQFWDGRAADLQEQAGGPIANPGEMASNHGLAVQVLQSIPGYVSSFKAVYGDDKVTIDRVTESIAEFEMSLMTPDSRFDQWLKGDAKALDQQELAGYELFKTSGCLGCHNGPGLGGTSFQKLGVFKPYLTENEAIGRAAVTGKESDRFVFKVPLLRNIELTYPYFHDGEVESLGQAVDLMGELQLGRKFSAQENEQIVAFLKTLTGRQPDFPLPALPPSTPATPQPKPF